MRVVSCLHCGVSQREMSRRFRRQHDGHTLTEGEIVGFNSDPKFALGSVQTMTVTSLHSLATSTTAGWQSAVVDNTSNLYLDAIVFVVCSWGGAGSPGADFCVPFFAYGGIESGVYTNPFSGSEGTLTLVDITANNLSAKFLGSVIHTASGAEDVEAGPWPVSRCFGGTLPPYWGLGAMNRSNKTLQSSGNAVKWRGLYATVI